MVNSWEFNGQALIRVSKKSKCKNKKKMSLAVSKKNKKSNSYALVSKN